jgi:excisionase family DNA binding protein
VNKNIDNFLGGKMVIKDREVMTVEQAADYLQVHENTVYKAIKDKKLQASKVGRHYRIQKSDIIKYLEKLKNDE